MVLNEAFHISLFKVTKRKLAYHHCIHIYCVYPTHIHRHVEYGRNVLLCTYVQCTYDHVQVYWLWKHRKKYLAIHSDSLQAVFVANADSRQVLERVHSIEKGNILHRDNQSMTVHFCDLKIIMSILFLRKSKYKL